MVNLSTLDETIPHGGSEVHIGILIIWMCLKIISLIIPQVPTTGRCTDRSMIPKGPTRRWRRPRLTVDGVIERRFSFIMAYLTYSYPRSHANSIGDILGAATDAI